jgi:hypothetical protein
MTDTTVLITESLSVMERVGCQFDMCTGPTLEPVDMRTCYVCELAAKLRVALGLPAEDEDGMEQ